MSLEQKTYLKKIKLSKILVLGIQIFIVLGLLLLWELLARKEIINTFLYSSPLKIFTCIIELFKNGLVRHILVTLQEIILSFLCGFGIGFVISILLYEFKILAKVFEPFLVMLNSLPKVALGPLIIIIAGANIKSIIFMALLINVIITIMNLYNGYNLVDHNRLMLMKSLHVSRFKILKYLIIPESFNIIVSSLKINISMTLIGVIMGEFLVSKEGIGYLIIYGTQIFNMNLVMSGIVVLIILSVVLYLLVSLIEKRLLKD